MLPEYKVYKYFVEETDIDVKIQKFQNVCGTTRRTFTGKTQKDTQIKFYHVMAVPYAAIRKRMLGNKRKT
jgi:hypothetical protein